MAYAVRHGPTNRLADIHPDPFYKQHTSADEACHSGEGNVGFYGAEKTSCDSPFSLVNATFDWIRDNLKDEIDFVIWTGDSARHDNDDNIPRTDQGIVDQNERIVSKFVEVFGKNDTLDDPDPTNDFVVPIVPTFGNNDILPHNIFEPGPNRWTRRYIDIWNRFIPEEQRHSFARGGWFYSEVIPNRLAVFSLNTLYFFDSNAATDGCDLESEPGYEHMDWLRIQLQFMRQRGMKAILIGHVPPARTEGKQNWDETCYQKYTLWMRQYRDVVIASVWGHMNIDHFMFQDMKELNYKFHIDGIDGRTRTKAREFEDLNNGTFSIASKSTYLNELRKGWSDLPTPPKGLSYSMGSIETQKDGRKQRRKQQKFFKEIGGLWAERFSMGYVSPSVVPNYYPTLRVIEYNITGLEKDHPATFPVGEVVDDLADEQHNRVVELTSIEDDLDMLKKKKHKKKRPVKPTFPVPHPPSKASLPGPAYSPQSLSLLAWTQYYANLTKINNEHADELLDISKKNKNPHTKHFQFKVEYDTRNDSAYHLPDLTVRSWLGLAERIGRDEYKRKEREEEDETFGLEDVNAQLKKPKNHVWRTFVKRAFVNTKADEELDEDFG